MGIKDVPIVGPWVGKITKIKRLFSVPCAINPLVWAEGYFVASPALLWSLYGPDCQDAAYARFRTPAGPVRSGHNKGSAGHRHALMNISASSLPVAAPSSGFGWALWQGAEFAQRVGWYMLLVDSFADWIIAGTSQAYKFQGCKDPNGAYCQMSTIPGLHAGLGAGEYLYSYWFVDGERIFNGGFSGVNCPPGYNPSVGVWHQQAPNMIPGTPDCSYQMRIEDATSGISSPWLDPMPGPNGERIFSHFAPDWGFTSGAHAYRVYVQKSFGVFWTQSGGMQVLGGPKFNLGPSFCAKTPLKWRPQD